MRKRLAAIILIATAACIAAHGQSVVTIRGVLLRSDRKPRAYTEIELIPLGVNKIINDSRLVSASDVRGRFWFNDVPPGKYTLSINFGDKPTDLSPYDTFFYPSAFDREEAEVLTIDKTTRLSNIIFRLPPALTPKTVKGRVLWGDGTPVMNAMIGFWDLRVESSAMGWGSVRSGAKGEFEVMGFVGRKYQLGAVVFDYIPRDPSERLGKIIGVGETGSFVIEDPSKEIEVLVKPPKTGEVFWKKYLEG